MTTAAGGEATDGSVPAGDCTLLIEMTTSVMFGTVEPRDCRAPEEMNLKDVEDRR